MTRTDLVEEGLTAGVAGGAMGLGTAAAMVEAEEEMGAAVETEAEAEEEMAEAAKLEEGLLTTSNDYNDCTSSFMSPDALTSERVLRG